MNAITTTDLPAFAGIVQHPSMQELLQQARSLASLPRPVLIRGERGTGKELLAHYIHANSPRSAQPFLPINCAALHDELLAAEIYGHQKGAFTGADQTVSGKLEQAHRGTLFLDEVGNMSLPFQEKMLRVIEYQQFQRLRGKEMLQVDVRIVSATNADLEEMMEENLFRRDFHDRISFASLRIPPLRERRSDIPTLILHFASQLAQEIPNLESKVFRRDTVEALMDYHWPGNIRELRNVVERLYCFILAPEITPADLPPEITGARVTGDSFQEKVEDFKRQLIVAKLQDTDGNQRRAAEELGMTYDQLRHYYRKYF